MKQENINSNHILFLSILWGLFLIGLQFAYFFGREDGFFGALNAITGYTPTCIAILLCSFSVGMLLRRLRIKKINLSNKQCYTIIVLCSFLFPIGLYFLFGKNKTLTLRA